MNPGVRSIQFLAGLLLLVPSAGAQDSSQPTPIVVGDFALSGSATAGTTGGRSQAGAAASGGRAENRATDKNRAADSSDPAEG